MTSAEDMLAAGRETGAWPIGVALRDMFSTSENLKVPGKAVVAKYLNGDLKALAAVGDRYQPLAPEGPESWSELVRAVTEAGGRPTGAFALRDFTRVLATWEVGDRNGFVTNFHLGDSYDGTIETTLGKSDTRIVCMNTFSSAMTQWGAEWARIRHSGDMAVKVRAMREAVGVAIKEGKEIRALYQQARDRSLTREQAESVLDQLFPIPEGKGARVTRASNKRAEAVRSMKRSENWEGANLASVWNAVTWDVDRDSQGNGKPTRGDSSPLDSLLFGTRAKRVEEILGVIKVILKDGTEVDMPIGEFALKQTEMGQGSSDLAGLLGSPSKLARDDRDDSM